jgi:hypothetical protein
LSVAEPLGVTRLNADAGNGIAYLLLSRNTLCLCFNAPFAGGLCRSARWIRLRPRANRKCKRNCDYECSPHSSLPLLWQETTTKRDGKDTDSFFATLA